MAEVPHVYRLVSQAAPCDALAAQVEQDLTQGNIPAVCLGVGELLHRRPDSVATLSSLSERHRALSWLTAEASEEAQLSLDAIAAQLGVIRCEELVSVTDDGLHALAIAKQLVPQSCTEQRFWSQLAREAANEAAYSDGSLQTELTSIHHTFGSDEPTYLELLGPLEILRLRSSTPPRALLLGSYGRWSAEEFADYVNKLDLRAAAHVIDIDEHCVACLRDVDGIILTQGDARSVPFAADSFDHVYTNQLFFFLASQWVEHRRYTNLAPDAARRSIRSVCEEAYRTLKPGGSFIAVERTYGVYTIDEPTATGDPAVRSNRLAAFAAEVTSLALQAGFEEPSVMWRRVVFPFRQHAGCSDIDDTGFVYYRQPLGLLPDFDGIGFRFVKSE